MFPDKVTEEMGNNPLLRREIILSKLTYLKDANQQWFTCAKRGKCACKICEKSIEAMKVEDREVDHGYVGYEGEPR